MFLHLVDRDLALMQPAKSPRDIIKYLDPKAGKNATSTTIATTMEEATSGAFNEGDSREILTAAISW